jgi:hypothetical protein
LNRKLIVIPSEVEARTQRRSPRGQAFNPADKPNDDFARSFDLAALRSV